MKIFVEKGLEFVGQLGFSKLIYIEFLFNSEGYCGFKGDGDICLFYELISSRVWFQVFDYVIGFVLFFLLYLE